MIEGLEQLDELAARLDRLSAVPRRAAELALPLLMKVARAEWSSGEAADGSPFEPLKHGGGVPIAALTAQNAGHVDGTAVVITTPDEEKFHQGGYFVHAGGAQAALKEAKAAAVHAKANADTEGLKRARQRIRGAKKAIRTEGTHVAKRPPLPVSRKSLPVPWALSLKEAFDRAMAEAMGGLAA